MAELPPLIGSAPALAALLDRVSALAPLDRPVLVVGERGTGKELVAARLHFLSRRWDGPFVAINCAALSPELLDSELFGHEAGAFTGAARRHAGRFERAEGGTLFLDELAAADARTQEKLLRAVEYGEIERVGGSSPIQVDVRLVAATNVDLPREVEAGRFRADLLDRLAFDVLTLPPLRARREDIGALALHFATAMAHALDRPPFPGFSDGAMAALEAHAWRGIVRELRNAVERSVHRAPPDRPVEAIVLDPFDSPWRPGISAPQAESPAAQTPASDLAGAVAAFERARLLEALEAQRWHLGRAAAALGLSYDQLRGAMRRHGLSRGT
jgi:psp operon transcriptional activator